MKHTLALLLTLLMLLPLTLPAGAETASAAQGAVKLTLKAGETALNAQSAPDEITAEATLGMLDGVPYVTLSTPFTKPFTLCYTAGDGVLLHDLEQDAWHRLTYQGLPLTPGNLSAAFKAQTGYSPEDLMAALTADAALIGEKLAAYMEALAQKPSVSLLLNKLQALDSGTFSLSGSTVQAALSEAFSPLMPYLYLAQPPVFDGLALKDLYEQLYWTNRSQVNRTLRTLAQALQTLSGSDALDFALQWKLDTLPGFFRFHCPAFDLALDFFDNQMQQTEISGYIHIEHEQDILLNGYVTRDGRLLLTASAAEFRATASMLVDARAQSANLLITGRTMGDDGAWGESFRWAADCVAGQDGLILSFDLDASRATLAFSADDRKASVTFNAGVEYAPTAHRAAFMRLGLPAKAEVTLEQTADGGFVLSYEDAPVSTAPRYAHLFVSPVPPALALPEGDIASMALEDA